MKLYVAKAIVMDWMTKLGEEHAGHLAELATAQERAIVDDTEEARAEYRVQIGRFMLETGAVKP